MIEKVQKVNVNNPKANSGCVLLRLHKTWEDDMDIMVYKALQIIQMHFTRDTSDSPAGTAQLTNLSSKIGAFIHKFIQRDPIPWNMEVRLGDLFIEAFYNNDGTHSFIDLYYPEIRNGSHIVSADFDWPLLAKLPEALSRVNLQATIFTRPENISSMVQANAHSIIKGKSEGDALDIDSIFVKGINKLQQTGWRINERIYDAFMDYEFVSNDSVEDDDLEKKRLSKKVEESFIKRKAKVLQDKDVFYQYIDADYRGRLYYIEPFLNYQGSDLARGILQFAKAKPMTESGLQWLAIHTACSYNQSYKKDEIPEWCEADYRTYLEDEGLDDIAVDKMTLSDRIRWTNENMDLIREWGKTCEFREEAEKKVCLLACCLEWVDYHVSVKRNVMHMTRLPIPIDGSNNGWQHLGAISQDIQTNTLVGLIPVKIQKDFYVQTAKELIHLTTDERLLSILEKMPMKKIRKGISKRGSMTRAYSAGAEKIGDNMWTDCKAEDYHLEYGITHEDCLALAKVLIKAIKNVCPGPLDTMKYFQRLAAYEIGTFKWFDIEGNSVEKRRRELRKELKGLYSKEDKTDEELEELNTLIEELNTHILEKTEGNGARDISWTTPSGFNVVYEKYSMKDREAKGTIAGYIKYNKVGRVNHRMKVATAAPDVQGFMSGISPNIIHSMDASHMSLVLSSWGSEFGAVHDSFSAHASDVEDLLHLTKEKFIEMYYEKNFYDYIRNEILSDDEEFEWKPPILGDTDLYNMYESDYFFA